MVTLDLIPDDASQHPERPDESATDLTAVLAGLRGRGMDCSILRTSVAGETDIRVLVRCPPEVVTVELLGPAAGESGWDAVRVDGESRQVWRGYTTREPGLLARFVADLLACTEAALGQRYLRLG